MVDQIPNATFANELADLLHETFANTQGIYLDRGNSLLETLDRIPAADASRPASIGGSSIAGHVEHIRYYIDVLSCYILEQEVGKVDWNESWNVREVGPEEWDKLREQLRRRHQELVSAIKSVEQWGGEDRIGASLAVLAHTAYHLGAIRQMLRQPMTQS